MAALTSCSLDFSREHVPAATNSFDEIRILRIHLDLTTKAADLHVDGAVERNGGTPARHIQQLITIEHTARMIDESDQEVIFPGGQGNAVVAPAQGTGRGIEFETCKHDFIHPAFAGSSIGFRAVLPPGQ